MDALEKVDALPILHYITVSLLKACKCIFNGSSPCMAACLKGFVETFELRENFYRNYIYCYIMVVN